MRYVWSTWLKGLAAVLPVALTLYLVYWLGLSVENLFRPLIATVLTERYYWPGMGLATGVLLLFFAGLIVNAWLIRSLIRAGERLLERIPLVKSVYGALRDFTGFFSSARGRKDLKRVVLVSMQDMSLIGFLTREEVQGIPGASESDEIVAVYLPMSYQIGGYTVYVPRSRVTAMDMTVEDAMRQVLTGGLSESDRRAA